MARWRPGVVEFREHGGKGDDDLTTAARELLTTPLPETANDGMYVWMAKAVSQYSQRKAYARANQTSIVSIFILLYCAKLRTVRFS